jgi:hypothetical protein
LKSIRTTYGTSLGTVTVLRDIEGNKVAALRACEGGLSVTTGRSSRFLTKLCRKHGKVIGCGYAKEDVDTIVSILK